MRKPLKKTRFSRELDTILWLTSGDCRSAMIFGGLAQAALSLLDVAFLVFFTRSMALLQVKKSFAFAVPVFGSTEISFKVMFFLLFFIIFFKNVASSLVQRGMIYALAKQEAKVATYFAGASLYEKSDQAKFEGTVDLSQFSIQIVNQIFTQLLRSLISLVTEAITLVFIFSSILILNPVVAIFCTFFFGIVFMATVKIVGYRQRRNGMTVYASNRDVLRKLNDYQLLREEILLSHSEQHFLGAILESKKRATNASASSAWLSTFPRYMSETLFIFVILVLTEVFSRNGDSSVLVGIYALLVGVGYRALPSFNTILVASGTFRSITPTLSRVSDLAERFNIRNRPIPSKILWRDSGFVEFNGDLILRDVSFSYPNSPKEIFHQLNLLLPAKTTTLVEGKSGTGKTTLLELVSGLLSPNSGKIYMHIDGENMEMDSSVKGISYLNQAIPMFDNSIGFNIAMRNIGHHDYEIMGRILKEVGLAEMLENGNVGLDRKIGENGAMLSAGEKQRLGIARALFQNSTLLIFDEPTSNLDDYNESLFWKILQNLKGKVTIIIASHRNAPKNALDQIVSLDDV
jgi:ATP-binding cassette, subfamily B, bacterial PglK